MMKCWEEDPSDRPTFEKLRKTMKDMERNHKVKKSRDDFGYLWDNVTVEAVCMHTSLYHP